MNDNQLPELRSHLGLIDTLRVGVSGLRTRKLRATLSAVGITLGIATLVMIRRITPVSQVATVSNVSGGVYRNDLINEGRTKGITIFASDLNLLKVQRGSLQEGMFLSEVSSEFPAVVLGAVAAERLGIKKISTEQLVWLGGEWFTVIGILNPLILAADLDRGAIIGYGAAEAYLKHDPVADVIYVRADPDYIHDVRSVMAATVNPQYPDEVQVSRA